MKKKRIAMFLVATLTFSQSMGAVIPVAAEELTADTGQETAETEESEEIVQENGGSETTGEVASVPDLEDEEELSLQDDAENAEEEIAEEENTSETTELSGDNTENQEAFSDGSEAGESAAANEQYQLNLIFEGASGGQDLLPNSRVRIKSRLVDTIGCSDVSAYELKVAPVTGGNGVKMADVSLDGQDIVLDVYNKTGDARISATASINGTEVAKREFWVNISEYVILPEKITDTSGNEINLEVGQQLDIAKDMKPQLVRYKDGKGDPIPLTGDNYKIVMSQTGPGGEEFRDYDADGLKWIEVPGQDLPILERTTENSTWFALLAMERSENGDWHYITRHHYELTSLISNDYDNGHNDDSEEKSSYRLVYDYQDTTGNGAMLPNSQMTATTYLEDKTKDYQRVDDYKLEILEQSKLADISVSADGKKLVIKSGNKTGQGCCYISVQIPDGKGGYREAFRKDIWFEVSEFMLLPENLTDKNGKLLNPAVGESINLANLKVKLVQYINGKGDPVEITGNDIKIVVMSWKDTESGKLQYDYDDEAWNMQKVSGQELPIMTRKSDDNTRLALSAMRKNKNGEWERLVRKHFEIGENSSKHSHSWKAVKTVQATCTSKGSRTDKCTSCDGVRTVTLPAKHTAVKDAAVAATVFKAGKKEGSHCKVCGKVLRKQITVAKLKPTISLTTSSLKMKAGQSTTAFKAAGLAKGDYVTKVTSGNTGIVKVSSVTKKGTFRLTAGKKAGSTTVKVILASKKSASFKVTVQRGVVKTSKITVSTKSVTLKKGTTYRKLASSVKVTPVTSQEKVTYTSSNKKIVTVTSGGVIKGLKKGTATITIRSGSKRTTCKVTVK